MRTASLGVEEGREENEGWIVGLHFDLAAVQPSCGCIRARVLRKVW